MSLEYPKAVLDGISGKVGLACEKLIAVQYRGNSAQQMGKYGRRQSRESVVVLKKLTV